MMKKDHKILKHDETNYQFIIFHCIYREWNPGLLLGRQLS